MNDYIKREDVLKLFTGGGKYPEGSFQRCLGEMGESLVMQIPFANVVEDYEYDRARRALAWMWYAYVNKDGECPHDFERRAVEMAEEVLGKWEDCMPELMREGAPVPRCGTWRVREDEYGICNLRCGECGGEWDFYCIDDVQKFSFHYCPNCGARMEMPND